MMRGLYQDRYSFCLDEIVPDDCRVHEIATVPNME